MTGGEIQQRLEAFGITLDGIVQAFVKPHNETPAPNLVYHYTDDRGLKGILETGKLWLNDIFSLNDPKEVQHGYEMALGELRAESARRGVSGADAPLNWAEQTLQWQGMRGIAHLFVASFSASGDDLGQWRAYADDGRGFVLAFDGRLLERAFVESDADHNNSFKIIYNENELRSVQQSIAAAYVDLIDEAVSLGWDIRDWNFERAAYGIYANAAITTGLHFKHPAYTNESEFRLLQVFDATKPINVEKRTRPYRLIRYREFDWRKHHGLLKQITVGPANATQAVRFAQDCLQEFCSDHSSIHLSLSRTPYQGR